MTDKELNQIAVQHLAPHINRVARKIKGSPKGNLICQACGAKNASRNRQRTAYVDDEKNFSTLCPRCQDENDEYWDERWNEYYSSVM